MKELTQDQLKVLDNIKRLIEHSKTTTNEKKIEKWIEKLNEDFSLTDKQKEYITEILLVKENSFSPNSSDGFLLKGFLMKLEEEGIRFPLREKNEIKFDFVDNFNLDYVYKFVVKKLETNKKEEEKNKIKELYFNDKKSIKEISEITKIEEKKIQTLINRIERTPIMRKANPKVKED